jgi:hypothetical protein
MSEYNLIRNAQVEVISQRDKTNAPIAQIIVDDQYIHTFDAKSRISQALLMMEEKDLKSKLEGGSYFFVGDKLVDFRDASYNGFVHNDAAIHQLMNILGIRDESNASERNVMRLNTVANSGQILNKLWADDDFHVDGYLDGGEFSSRISFTWNPYSSSVRGVFEIIRQICSNGMVGVSDLINCRVPLINRWEEHLNIAAIQLRNLVQSSTSARLTEMQHERATVKELQLIKQHASERLDYAINITDPVKRQTLVNIGRVVDPERHLSDVYNSEVFSNAALGSRAPGHLSKMDAWNCVTEVFTHTLETSTSTGSALQRIANGIVFPAKDANKGVIANHAPIKSAFSDPELAFFGNIIV